MTETLAVHIYRNRQDDKRRPHQLHFCSACSGWYGVSHDDCHCQQGDARYPYSCACRFCRSASGKPIEGSYGIFIEPASTAEVKS